MEKKGQTDVYKGDISYQNSLILLCWLIRLAVTTVFVELFHELSYVDRSICWFSLYHSEIRNNCARRKTALKHNLLEKAKAHILMGYDGTKSCVFSTFTILCNCQHIKHCFLAYNGILSHFCLCLFNMSMFNMSLP